MLLDTQLEDATIMHEALKVYHPTAHSTLLKESKAADRMGNSGINTYKCRNYCSPQHTDPNRDCPSMSVQAELKALPGEFAFCQPTYSYYC
jgi:hypothetical protein